MVLLWRACVCVCVGGAQVLLSFFGSWLIYFKIIVKEVTSFSGHVSLRLLLASRPPSGRLKWFLGFEGISGSEEGVWFPP